MTDYLVLVANAGDGTITTYRLADDALTPLATSHVGTGCATFAVDPGRDLVYAASKDGPAIVTCALDRATGSLTPLRSVAARGNPTYLELAHGGTVLLTAYYHQGVGDARLVDDGVVGDVAGQIENANLHCVVASSDSRHAYFVSLGDDLVVACEVGPDASLVRLANAPAPTGCGPRHLTLDNDEGNAYVATEFSGEILHFVRDRATGELTPAGETTVVDPGYGLGHSRFGADPAAEHLIWGADVHLSADSATLWSTERTESVLATSQILTNGSVGTPTSYLRTERQPRGFGVSPDGRHLVVAGELSATVSLYRVGPDGSLQDLGATATGAGSNWVRFV